MMKIINQYQAFRRRYSSAATAEGKLSSHITPAEPLPLLLEIPRSSLVIVEGRAPVWRSGTALHQLRGSPLVKRYLSFIANIETMDIEAEVVEMKQMLVEISRKIDDVLDESLTAALMKLSEESIMELYKDEPDLYSIADLKVRYK